MLKDDAAMQGLASGRCRATLCTAAILYLFALVFPISVGAQGDADQLQFVGGGEGLTFGALVPGEPRRIDPQVDVGARAEFRIVGRQSEGLVWFEMPSELVHTRNQHRIRLTFGGGDGLQIRAQGRQPVPFTPGVDQLKVRHTGENTETIIYLGGTATPSADQPGGEYQATITAFIVPDS